MRIITPRIALELLAHEGLVRETYRDSQGIWTWSVGITNASGHRVHPRYLDNPQPLERCLGVFIWALRTRYLPAVIAAFGEYDPAEHELAAALSFHYNTGGIGRAEWVRRFRAGDRAGARAAFLNWCRPQEILPRRRRERDLFFDGAWTEDGTVLLYDVAKPSYKPTRGRRVAIGETVTRLILDETSASPSEPITTEPAGCESLTSEPATTDPARTSWFDRLFGFA